ncbi:MAG: O-antigen ligase family protein [Planctomycetota bacterium]|jgi:hypothetical protein|nr:O-antigen ligase family protein [Planctomycetota bacterium]
MDVPAPSRLALPALVAAGGGCLFLLAARGQYAQFLTLGMFGLWIACLLRIAGALNKAAFFWFGFFAVINPRKYFGLPESTSGIALSYGQAAYQFISVFDLALLLLAALLFFGQLPGESRRSNSSLPKWTRIGLAGFAAVAIASCAYAPSIDRAIAQIVFDAKLVLMLAVLSSVFSDRKRLGEYLPLLVSGLVAACALEVFVSMLEYAGFLRTSRNILGVPVGKGLREVMAGATSMFRIAGTYGHANNLGAAMAAAGLLIWELQIAVHPSLRWRKIAWGVWTGVVCVFLLSFSRGAWAAMAGAAAFYLPFALKIQGRAWFNAFLKRYAFVSVFGAAVLIAVLWQPLERRLFHSDPGAIQSRVGINAASIDYVSKNPFFGGGIGNHSVLTENYPYIREVTRFSRVPVPAHNIYLYWTTEIGFVGAFFYFLIPAGIFFSGMRRCLKYPKDPAAPIAFAFTNAIVIFWISDCFSPLTRQIDCAYLYWMLMGCAAGTQRLLGDSPETPPALGT